MTWLLGQLWPVLMLSALLGAATVVVFSLRRESVEVWQDVPLAPPAASTGPVAADEETDREADEETATTGGTSVPVDADDPGSPFPVAGDGPAPWEAEELWSRPARVGAGGEARRPKDEWTEAAENWRSWADEATGRGYAGADDAVSSRDRDLFAADRDLFAADREPDAPAATPAAHAAGGPTPRATPGPAAHQEGDEHAEVFPGLGAQDADAFPYARPVEAPRTRDETMDPMDDHEMTDDEREAAEIRRMREQARRGDTA